MTDREKLVAFFNNERVHPSGLTLSEMLGQDDLWWDKRHDFIQWMFPLPVPSNYNPNAPLLDQTTAALVQNKHHLSLERFGSFLGVSFSSRRQLSSVWWFTPGNHNLLRITRVITSLRLSGMEHSALSVLRTVAELQKKHGHPLPKDTLLIWLMAATSSWDDFKS